MGTRYNISREDIEKAGLKIIDDGALLYLEEGICGWGFSSFFGEVFSGPNIGKEELDSWFKEHNIKPEYY